MQAEIKSNWSVRRLVFDDNEGCERCLDLDEKERHETTDQELYFLLTTKNDMPKDNATQFVSLRRTSKMKTIAAMDAEYQTQIVDNMFDMGALFWNRQDDSQDCQSQEEYNLLMKSNKITARDWFVKARDLDHRG